MKRRAHRRVQVPITPDIERLLDSEIERAAALGIRLTDAAALSAVLTRVACGIAAPEPR